METYRVWLHAQYDHLYVSATFRNTDGYFHDNTAPHILRNFAILLNSQSPELRY
jgi:hypothetical protein